MDFLKKNFKTIIVIALIIGVVVYLLNNKKDESSYVKCLCKGVKGPGGGPYYNFHCCKRASASGGSVATGVA